MADERHEWFLNQIFRHRAALYRYLRKFTSGAEDIEDLVQETYVRVYALSYTQAVDSPRAVVISHCHNMAVERARRQKSQATDSVADLERLTVYSSDAPAMSRSTRAADSSLSVPRWIVCRRCAGACSYAKGVSTVPRRNCGGSRFRTAR